MNLIRNQLTATFLMLALTAACGGADTPPDGVLGLRGDGSKAIGTCAPYEKLCSPPGVDQQAVVQCQQDGASTQPLDYCGAANTCTICGATPTCTPPPSFTLDVTAGPHPGHYTDACGDVTLEVTTGGLNGDPTTVATVNLAGKYLWTFDLNLGHIPSGVPQVFNVPNWVWGRDPRFLKIEGRGPDIRIFDGVMGPAYGSTPMPEPGTYSVTHEGGVSGSSLHFQLDAPMIFPANTSVRYAPVKLDLTFRVP